MFFLCQIGYLRVDRADTEFTFVEMKSVNMGQLVT